MSNQLTFQNTQLSITNRNGQIWLSSKELAKALSYADTKAVTRIYNQYSDEFTSSMSTVVDSTTVRNAPYKERFFSLRGAHLIAMFSRTEIAKDFRKWVLDILDKECGIAKIDNYITHSQEQELIREINRCVERIKEHCELISERLCEKFNINLRSELKANQLDEAIYFLRNITKKDIVKMRYLVEVKITDYMFNGEKTINGRCNDFNALLTHLALKLGYKIERLASSQQTLSI